MMGEQAEHADRLLNSALKHLSVGEAIPLHWAIEHGAHVQEAWTHSRDPELLLSLAAYALPREELALAACAVARTVLLDIEHDAGAMTAIEATESWAGAHATAMDVKTTADVSRSIAVSSSCTHWGWVAARDAARAAIATTAGEAAQHAANSVRCAVSSRACHAVQSLSPEQIDIDTEVVAACTAIAIVVHKQFAHRNVEVTMGDLVRAAATGRPR